MSARDRVDVEGRSTVAGRQHFTPPDAVTALLELVDAYRRGAGEPELAYFYAVALAAIELEADLIFPPGCDECLEAVA